MALDTLASASKNRPVYIVGGLPVEEKVALLRKRYGIHAVWEPVYRDKGFEPIARRIEAGSASGVVLLEHLMGHRTSHHIGSACRSSGTPMTYAGRGGTAALEKAMEFLGTKVP